MAMAVRRVDFVPVTVRGFRSSFRDWSAERTQVPRDVCEAALAHTIREKVEAVYRRTDLFEKRRVLMAQWSRFLANETGERARAPGIIKHLEQVGYLSNARITDVSFARGCLDKGCPSSLHDWAYYLDS